MVTTMNLRGVARASCLANWCVVILLLGIPSARAPCPIRMSEQDVHVVAGGDPYRVQLIRWDTLSTGVTVTGIVQHADILEVKPITIDVAAGSSGTNSYNIDVFGKKAGHSDVLYDDNPVGIIDMTTVFLRVTVMHSASVKVLSDIIGWIYCIAWSLSFYPQVYTNWKRKSVVGLHFDFVSMNIVGFIVYSFFNCGLYFDRAIQREYFRRFPRGHNPVHLNDVIFSVHASLITMVVISQIRIYERGQQRVSNIMRCILTVMGVILIGSLIFCIFGKMHWLDFLYNCSYVKLATTLVKYIPQAVLNYKRKSTAGWSIGNVMLDFTGGVASVLQMLLNGWNYDDWLSIFGDFTKFGLGLFSLSFMLIFITQHFILYRADESSSAQWFEPRKACNLLCAIYFITTALCTVKENIVMKPDSNSARQHQDPLNKTVSNSRLKNYLNGADIPNGGQ